MKKTLVKRYENCFGTGYGKRHHRKSQHKQLRGRINNLLIRQGLDDYELEEGDYQKIWVITW